MEVLEIEATVRSVKALPSYDFQFDVSQRIACFVDGELPVEGELRGIERFRQTVVALMLDGLKHAVDPDVDDSDTPFAFVDLTARDHADGRDLFKAFVGLEQIQGDADGWIARWQGADGLDRRRQFTALAPAAAMIKKELDRQTAQWFKLVEFHPARTEG